MNIKEIICGSLFLTAVPMIVCAEESIEDAVIRKINQISVKDNFQLNIPGIINDHVVLGTAYHSDKKDFLNVQTVDGRVEERLGNTRVNFELVNNGSYDDVLRQLNGNIDVDVTFPVVRVKAGGHIAKELASTSFSNSYTFQASLTPKKRVLLPKDTNVGFKLTAAGSTLANQYQSRLLEMAGDSFISEIEYGAQLLVNLKVEYLSEKHKDDIGGYLGVSYGAGNLGISVDGKLQYIDEDIKRSVRITVRAMQKGGDPKKLLSVIPNNIISCSLNNYKPCFTLFEQIVNYARSDFGKQFNNLSDYNVVRYKAVPYEVSSLDVRRLDIDKEEIRAETTYRIFWLEEQFKKSIAHEHRAKSILTKYASWMTADQRLKAENIQNSAYDNAWIYQEFATNCRNNPYGTACPDSWNDFLEGCGAAGLPCIKKYTLSDLSIPTSDVNRYFQCDSARESTANFGIETLDNTVGYRSVGWAPVLTEAKTPKNGVLAWVPCQFALPTYGNAFTD